MKRSPEASRDLYSELMRTLFSETQEAYSRKPKGTLGQARDTIRSWLESGSYPSDFLHFFFQWTLLNLYYNALSQESEEVLRALEFGREYKDFQQLRKSALSILKDECVGDGRYDAPPSSWVKTASIQLRRRLRISQREVCCTCRKEKRMRCKSVACENYPFVDTEALIRILYQVRCNLFHGDKTEYTNGKQAERNRKLVRASNLILEAILKTIAQVQE